MQGVLVRAREKATPALPREWFPSPCSGSKRTRRGYMLMPTLTPCPSPTIGRGEPNRPLSKERAR